jgi:hypothetical protein
MLDSEWPRVKANFQRRLEPENFTANGQQKMSLSVINSSPSDSNCRA